MIYKDSKWFKTVRLKFIFLVISLVVISLNSCRKKESYIKIEPEKTKTITVKLELPDSDNSRAVVEKPYINSAAIITVVDVYFFNIDNGLIHTKVTLTKSEIIQISSESGLLFHNLNADVDGIAVVANNNERKDISISEKRDMYDLFNKPLNIAHEQHFDDVTLYGKSLTLVELESENIDPEIEYFTTSISIKPLVSRMEVSGLVCIDMDITGSIRSLSLHSVFFDHTFQQVTLDTEKVIDKSFFLSEAAVVETHPSDWWIYSYNSDFPSIPNSNHNETPFSPDVINPTQLGDGVFAFHFISVGIKPWIRLHMKSSLSSKAWYLNVKGFTKADAYAPITFEPGFVYKIEMPFKENEVTSFDDLQKSITVEVTVQDWAIINEIIPSTNK